MEGTAGNGRLLTRFLLTLLYLAAGYFHLTRPEIFLAIMPRWVPFEAPVVMLTGAAEVAGAIGLWVPRLQKAAGISLALYALFVWPANFQHYYNDMDSGGGLPDTYHIPRLLFQPVLIWAALWCSHIINWPFKHDGN